MEPLNRDCHVENITFLKFKKKNEILSFFKNKNIIEEKLARLNIVEKQKDLTNFY